MKEEEIWTGQEKLEFSDFWKEAKLLEMFLDKERSVFTGTPYFRKLQEVTTDS